MPRPAPAEPPSTAPDSGSAARRRARRITDSDPGPGPAAIRGDCGRSGRAGPHPAGGESEAPPSLSGAH
eukprot:384942-Hanusia_phi.AAC.1